MIYSAVACFEEFQTVSEEYALGVGMSPSVTLRCAWADRHALAADLLGNKRPYPQAPGANPPQANRVAIMPAPQQYAAVGQGIIYQEALVTVSYSHEIKDLISESIEPTAEFITQDYRKYRWTDENGDPLLEAEAPGKLVRGLTLCRTMYEVPALPATLLTECGKVNGSPYTSSLLGLTFATETLLFTPPFTRRTITTAGSDGFTVDLKFMYKPETWNKFWRSKTQQYEEIFDIEKSPPAPHKNNPVGNFAAFLF